MSKFGMKIEFSPLYSPWSNGINERIHYSANIVVRKLMDEDKKMLLIDAVELVV